MKGITTTEKTDNLLRDFWASMMNDASPNMMQFAAGYITAFRDAELISDDLRELWLHRIKRCPDAEDHAHALEFGEWCNRAWCAYCGTLPDMKPEPTTDEMAEAEEVAE